MNGKSFVGKNFALDNTNKFVEKLCGDCLFIIYFLIYFQATFLVKLPNLLMFSAIASYNNLKFHLYLEMIHEILNLYCNLKIPYEILKSQILNYQ